MAMARTPRARSESRSTSMPIPTRADYSLSNIGELADLVLLRLRTWHRAGPNRDPGLVRDALKQYIGAVQAFIDGDGDA